MYDFTLGCFSLIKHFLIYFNVTLYKTHSTHSMFPQNVLSKSFVNNILPIKIIGEGGVCFQ